MESSVNFTEQEKSTNGDTIKLFVGQIPRTWDETELREILEPFGAIQELTVLRDRMSGTHKGCAFVTYMTRQAAVEAQKALHEKKTLPDMNHPMQVKPATTEPKLTPVEERRLFVGMLNRDFTEEDVMAMFSTYGHVEDVSILRNKEGVSKGAAFVRMSSKSEALQAITALHQSQTMPNCSAPLVVKKADTEKEKSAKRIQTQMASLSSVNPLGINTALGIGSLQAAAYCQLLQLQQATQPGGATANNSFGLGTSLGNNLALAALTQQQAATQNSSSAYAPQSVGAGSLGNLSSAMLSAASATGQQPAAAAHPQMKNIPGMSVLSNDAILQAYLGMQQPGGQPYANSYPTAIGGLQHLSSSYAYQKQREETTAKEKARRESSPSTKFLCARVAPRSASSASDGTGPDGSNLFIYHLPNDVTDNDLLQMFAPFGNVISAKVFIDKATCLSKCFGFISYDNALSAQSAIQSMNGFQIGTKRLKVQHKRPKDANKPY